MIESEREPNLCPAKLIELKNAILNHRCPDRMTQWDLGSYKWINNSSLLIQTYRTPLYTLSIFIKFFCGVIFCLFHE